MSVEFTEDQMDRAISLAYDSASKHGSVNHHDIKAELARPAIRATVPVLYVARLIYVEPNDEVAFFGRLTSKQKQQDVRVLIPAPLVEKMFEKVVRWAVMHNHLTAIDKGRELIAHYTAHGLTNDGD